jgi:hypothetical protein
MKITIPAPCEQKWNEMKSCGLNRFCTNCEKEIIDFTFYSDAALRKVIEEKEGKICGKFTKNQLNRKLVTLPKKQSFFRKFSAKWLSFYLLLSSPFETLKAQVPTEQSANWKTMNSDTTTKNVISGIVVDAQNERIPFVKIKLIELGKIAMTHMDGKFRFVFEDSTNSTYSIEAWSLGFEDTTRITKILPYSTDIRIELKDSKIEGIEMVGVIVVQPKIDVFEPKTWIPRQNRRNRKN